MEPNIFPGEGVCSSEKKMFAKRLPMPFFSITLPFKLTKFYIFDGGKSKYPFFLDQCMRIASLLVFERSDVL